MPVARKALLLGAGLVAGVGVLVLSAKKATAEEGPSAPGARPGTSTRYPWMRYSANTLEIQRKINDWLSAEGMPTIKEDGILGPQTCAAWREWADNNPVIAPPSTCISTTSPGGSTTPTAEELSRDYREYLSQEYPWMRYSARTLAIQRLINQWRAEFTNLPPIAEDGILGPETCAAWKHWSENDMVYASYPPPTCR